LRDSEGVSKGTAAMKPNRNFPVIFHKTNSKEWKFLISGNGEEMKLLAE
jgi:hypothetical protein